MGMCRLWVEGNAKGENLIFVVCIPNRLLSAIIAKGLMTRINAPAALLGIVCSILVSVVSPVEVSAQIPQVRHVIIVMQENRTPDNLFHNLNKYLPDADIADSGVNSLGETIALTPLPLSATYDIDHSHAAFLAMYDGGKMDGADLQICFHGKKRDNCPPDVAFTFVDHTDVEPYFQIARNYGFANRMFQSQQGPSLPGHMMVFGGTTQLTADSPSFLADNIVGGSAGCASPPKARVIVVGPEGVEPSVYPCTDHMTLVDLLDAARISWRYYTPGFNNIWTAPNAIRHLCKPAGTPRQCTSPLWNRNVVIPPAQVLNDIADGDLKNVSWVIPTAQDSDHPTSNNGAGPSWVASVVNAVGKGRYWRDTVILITWDEWGGWYDHVKPPVDPTYGYYEYGFRVPLLVVSAYTPKGYVSPVTHDFGSILHFVETVFNLGQIPPGNFIDARADDLLDFFDFTQKPRAFTNIFQPLPVSYFLNPNRSMIIPDDD
jgi:phospholipase C